MKRATVFVLVFAAITLMVLTGSVATIYAAQADYPETAAEAAILVEQKTGAVLYAKNADKQMFPASTTKILTALIAVEEGDVDEMVTVGNEVLWIPWDSSKAGLMAEDRLTLRELLYGLMLPSGNDAAYTIAVHIGRKIAGNPDLPIGAALDVFVERMNRRARELGAMHSNFTAPDGYHDDEHYTTARDLALIARAAMAHPLLRKVVATGHFTPQTWTGEYVRPWGNTNLLIRPYQFSYEHATGIKTGYTGPAGFCIVASAARDDLELIAVVLNTSKDGRWLDSVGLLEYGFANYVWLQLVEANEIVQRATVAGQDVGQPDRVDIAAARGFAAVFPRRDVSRICSSVRLLPEAVAGAVASRLSAAEKPTLAAPLDKDQVVGELVFSLDDQELFKTPLVVTEPVAAMPWWRPVLRPGLVFLSLGASAAAAFRAGRRRKRRRSIFKTRKKRFGM
ncbi:MAG TPA: D-alanyl-D-alanine carboxypeptidase family protein [Bacillota bacterium]|nr:D-alanyl-D-alanine carboxypeptidase family protein [Bacillota bacterium]